MNPVASTDLADDLVQVLGSDGALHPQASDVMDVDQVDVEGLYRDMFMTRRLDTEAIALQRQGELGLWPSLLGQEAAQVGAARALRAQDMVFPTYREHGVAWCRGVDPVDLLGLFRGTTLGGWNPHEHNMNVYTLVIGAQLLHGVGYAMGIARDGHVGTGDNTRDRAVLVFLGDGSLSEGETNEAFIWAATQNLPIVFFCQNNQWAISAPYSVQSRIPAARRADGFGFPGVRVDGNDVLACLAVTTAALDRARNGDGPTLVEAVTFRRNPHTTSDDAGRYRPAAEADYWEERDPLMRARKFLTGSEAEYPADTGLAEDSDALAVRLRAGCRALPDPTPGSPFDTTFVEITDDLSRQRDEHLAFVASLQDGGQR